MPIKIWNHVTGGIMRNGMITDLRAQVVEIVDGKNPAKS